MKDYNKSYIGVLEKVRILTLFVICIFLIAYLLYKNIIISFISSLFAIFLLRKYKKKKIIKEKKQLLYEFKDVLYMLSSEILSGNSIENSFLNINRNYKKNYNIDKSNMSDELNNIATKIENGINLVDILKDFSKRSHVVDIYNFVDIFTITNKIGGNINKIIVDTCEIINEKIGNENYIEVLLTKKKFEQKILYVIPLFILIVLNLMAPDYLKSLYINVGGRIVVTLVVFMIYISYLISEKIMDIKL